MDNVKEVVVLETLQHNIISINALLCEEDWNLMYYILNIPRIFVVIRVLSSGSGTQIVVKLWTDARAQYSLILASQPTLCENPIKWKTREIVTKDVPPILRSKVTFRVFNHICLWLIHISTASVSSSLYKRIQRSRLCHKSANYLVLHHTIILRNLV